MPGPGPAGDPVTDWDVSRPGAVAFTSMPLPHGDRVFVADTGGSLAALDSETGDELWEQDVGSPVYGAPAVTGDLVVVGTEVGEVVAYRIATGEEAWRRELDAGAVPASLLVADGAIYAATEGGSLAALSPADGAVTWTMPVGGRVTRGPAFAHGTLYVGVAGIGLLAIDPSTQVVRWTAQLGPGEVGTPAVSGGRVYVARGLLAVDAEHDLVALDVRDGREIWTFPSPGGEQMHVGAIAHGRVYAVSEGGSLYAIDPTTGRQVWTLFIGGRLATLATVAGDVVYVSSTDKTVRAVEFRIPRAALVDRCRRRPDDGRGGWRAGVRGDEPRSRRLDRRVRRPFLKSRRGLRRRSGPPTIRVPRASSPGRGPKNRLPAHPPERRPAPFRLAEVPP